MSFVRNPALPDGLDRAMTMRDFMRMASMDAGLVGSPIPKPHPVSLPCDTADSSSSGVSRGPRAGAAAAFNLDACMRMGEG